MTKPLTAIGWREWASLPDLGVKAIKVKVDTGARSSSLHAFDLETFEKDGESWVRFTVHPHQSKATDAIAVEAPLIDTRMVKSSSGVSDLRPVIKTTLQIGGVRRLIEVTLTRRDDMGFRMLVGREALRKTFSVEPNRSFVTGVPQAEGTRDAYLFGGQAVRAGMRKQIVLPISKLASGTQVNLPVLVVHGKLAGPTIWLSAAVHGDELNGVEIIRRVLEKLDENALRGTILAVPTVNVHGFARGERYLPDRRDLNRSFPGSVRGSLARRIANLLMTEVVKPSAFGIDLHTGSDGRTNLPQIRADLDDPETARLASAFGCPLMMNAKPIAKTLRHAATQAGAKVLLFEGGEALRLDGFAIEAGTNGVLRVLAALDMIDPMVPPAATHYRGEGSQWVRAARSGLAQLDCALGSVVEEDEVLGRINDSFGKHLGQLKSPCAGLIIGLKLDPLVNRGDAIVHVANTLPDTPAEASVEGLAEASVEAPAEETAEETAEAPAEATPEAPVEAPVEAMPEAPVETLAEAPAEAPSEAQPEAPADVQPEAPTEAQREP